MSNPSLLNVPLSNARTLVLQLRKAAISSPDAEQRGKLRTLAIKQEAIVRELEAVLS